MHSEDRQTTNIQLRTNCQFLSTKCVRFEQVAPASVEMIKKPIGGEKNGGFRMVPAKKVQKWYPADDVKKPVPSRRHIHKPTKLRDTITPGTVLIILAGAYRGSRVIFLKQLTSGLLLVTGPYAVNKVPLKRVEQAFVIATSTKVDVSGVDAASIDDAFFKRDKKKKETSADAMEVDDKEKESDKKTSGKKQGIKPTDERIAKQKEIDAKLVAVVEKTDLLPEYLKTKFALKKGQFPHEMKF